MTLLAIFSIILTHFSGLDKDIRVWDVYIHTEGMLKNMMTSLRAVTELQNPAIRDRHWIQLMQATKVFIFKIFYQFNLLKLFLFPNDINNFSKFFSFKYILNFQHFELLICKIHFLTKFLSR